jgi:NAD(P)-dependent dehydrogenase (short-subunit alcohol dehydrogenase family)
MRGGAVPEEFSPLSTEIETGLRAYVPLGRAGAVEECGRVAAFLASDLASYVTGTFIPVDGGTWASAGWLKQPDGGWGLYG